MNATRAGDRGVVRFIAILFAGALSLLGAEARAQDAWTRLNEQLQTLLPPNFLTLGSVTIEKDGVTIRDIVIQIPAEMSAGIAMPSFKIAKLTIQEFNDQPRLSDGSAGHARMELEGFEFPLSSFVDKATLASFGVDHALVDIIIDASINTPAETLTIHRFSMNFRGLAEFAVTAEMTGFSEQNLRNPMLLRDVSLVRKMTLSYADATFLAKVMPLMAAKSKTTPEVMARIAVAAFDRITPPPTPPADAVLDAVASFLLDFKAPAGPLVFEADPPKPMTMTQMATLNRLNELVEELGVTARYPATRPRNSAQRQSVSVAPLSDTCAPGRQSFALVGDAWRAATIREATSSNRCVVAIVGGSAQEIVLPPNRLTAWSAEGPGVPATRCASGDAVLVEQDGVWRTATVRNGDSKPDHCAVTLAGKNPGAVVIAPLSRLRAAP